MTVNDTPVCVGQGSASRLTACRNINTVAAKHSTLDGFTVHEFHLEPVSVAEKYMSIVFSMEAGRFEPSPERPQLCFSGPLSSPP